MEVFEARGLVNQAEIHRKIISNEVVERITAVYQLNINFADLPDNRQAWADLLQLTKDDDIYVRKDAAEVLGSAFPHVPDKEQAWADLYRLSQDENEFVRSTAVEAMGPAFPHVPDKEQAWADLCRLSQNEDWQVREAAVWAIGSAFQHVPDKEQAWADLRKLSQDEDCYVRFRAVEAMFSASPHVPDKERAWADIHRLSQDEDSDVRLLANYSLGRASIFKATEAESEEGFRKELEKALEFFERASKEQVSGNPAKFCLPFYRSFYTITFKKQEAEAEILAYLVEAKIATKGSENKQKLVEIIGNLANALKEVQDVREIDFDIMKRDLNAYRRYCGRAADLLAATGEKAPKATKMIKRGLPIIDRRIKEILAEIKKNSKALSKQTKGTPLEDLGNEIYQTGQNISLIRDPIGLEKQINIMEIALSSICNKLSEEERGEACQLLKMAKEEPYIEDKLPLFNLTLSKISSQMGKVRLDKKLDELMIFLKPGVHKDLVITVGAEVYGTGVKEVITIPQEAINYPELKEDLGKTKGKGIRLASLPSKLAKKIKNYLIQAKKEDLFSINFQ